jgi:putative hydrolase of the HAD superfamily
VRIEGIRVIVLDLDDTLYLERTYVRSGFAAVGTWMERHHGTAGLGELAWTLFSRGSRGQIFDEALVTLGLQPETELIGALVNVYRSHQPTIALEPDARRLLNRTRGKLPRGLITDGPAVAQRQKLAALGLLDDLEHIVVTDLWGREFWKPHHRAFLDVQQTFALSGASALYIADNPTKDFIAPRDLGWRTLRIARQDGIHLRGVTADHLVDAEACIGSLDDIAIGFDLAAASTDLLLAEPDSA